MSEFDLRLAGALLVAGPVVFLVGAARWDFAFEQEMKAALRAIDAQKARWRWVTTWMIPGTILTMLGLASLAHLLSRAGMLAWIGLVLFAVGGMFWIMHLTFRLSVTLWAADQTTSTGDVPALYPTLSEWAGLFYTVNMILSYLASAAAGAALVKAGALDAWVGWSGIGIGLVSAIGFVATRGGMPFAPPITVHLWPLIAGIMLLVRFG